MVGNQLNLIELYLEAVLLGQSPERAPCQPLRAFAGDADVSLDGVGVGAHPLEQSSVGEVGFSRSPSADGDFEAGFVFPEGCLGWMEALNEGGALLVSASSLFDEDFPRHIDGHRLLSRYAFACIRHKSPSHAASMHS